MSLRYSRIWPWLRPIYALIAPFIDLRPLLSGAGNGPSVADMPKARDRGSPPDPAEFAQQTPAGVAAGIPGFNSAVLYRIIGNDLWPRHKIGQSRENLAWILEHEPELPGCKKHWVVNRIVDPDEEKAILDLLESAKQPYLYIPFRWDEYRSIGWDTTGVPPEYAPGAQGFYRLSELMQGRVLMRLNRHKNNYVMNNNGARNAALDDGRSRAQWVLPWDGNCFVTTSGWREITEAICQHPSTRYHVVPMARFISNEDILTEGGRPEAKDEPQIIFHKDAQERFNEDFFYGRRPKVELFWRLGVPGPWDDWRQEPWDLDFPAFASEAGCFSVGGWVARLSSGQARHEVSKGEEAFQSRGLARVEAISSMLEKLDELAFGDTLNSADVRIANAGVIAENRSSTCLNSTLTETAEEALRRGPYSVVDKTSLPPSHNPHDYWHPAPYYWPHPLRIPGLPYVMRDGERVPGTRLYEAASERYDRTRLQRLFDDTWTLSLANQQTRDQRFGEHAASLVRHWFLNTETAMSPHLQYAQVRRGHDKNRGSKSGLIEFKDVYYFLDGVHLLLSEGALTARDRLGLENWFGEYLQWLRCSDQGVAERASTNNHGTYYDLQVASIAAFLGEWKLLRETLRDSRMRILAQFASDGRLPEELRRTTSAHYECFTIQGWVHLARLAESVGEDLWSYEGPDGQGLRRGMTWLLSYIGKPWPYEQINDFDEERFYPLLFAYQDKYGELRLNQSVPDSPAKVKPMFHPHDGIMPFWQFSLARLDG